MLDYNVDSLYYTHIPSLSHTSNVNSVLRYFFLMPFLLHTAYMNICIDSLSRDRKLLHVLFRLTYFLEKPTRIGAMLVMLYLFMINLSLAIPMILEVT